MQSTDKTGELQTPPRIADNPRDMGPVSPDGGGAAVPPTGPTRQALPAPHRATGPGPSRTT